MNKNQTEVSAKEIAKKVVIISKVPAEKANSKVIRA